MFKKCADLLDCSLSNTESKITTDIKAEEGKVILRSNELSQILNAKLVHQIKSKKINTNKINCDKVVSNDYSSCAFTQLLCALRTLTLKKWKSRF